MIRNIVALLIFITVALSINAQLPFKYDNTVYKAVYLNEAFRLMDSSSKYLLLDVRSPGEYADTSRHTALNIGRIKGAVNIDIDAVPAHLEELKKYTDQPVFIYCSHSQRSRRVSKLLAENGFTKVYNINGGMSVVNESDDKTFLYKSKVLVTNTSYKNIASADAIDLITNTADLVIIDIRTEKEFASKDTLLQNNIGRLKKAINISQDVFATKFDSYNIPKNKPVLLYDLYGHNSMDVVDILREKGFTHIYNLFEGLTYLISDHRLTNTLRNQLFANAPSYQLLDPKACIDLLTREPNIIVFDTRPADEFKNKSKIGYLNLGYIKGAINIASAEAAETLIRKKAGAAPILVYGSNSDLGMITCQELIKKGYKNVNFLSQGLYRFVWSTMNIENCKEGKKFLTNHEGLY
ncbi:MAG: rhodanese-like domain-containing protein [Chitinophagaceae bacterium]